MMTQSLLGPPASTELLDNPRRASSRYERFAALEACIAVLRFCKGAKESGLGTSMVKATVPDNGGSIG